MALKKKRYYVLTVHGDIEPEIGKPFKTTKERDRDARTIKDQVGDESGIFWLVQHPGGKLEIGSYSGKFFEERFRNNYRHCGTEWNDTADSACNDRCPLCNAEIEPYESEEL